MTTDQWQEMDEYCIKIIQFFLTTMQRYRFNELYRAISEAGARMSRPTLSEHLKHLVKQELVERKVEGVQTVTYTLNYGKFFNLKEIMELPDNMLEKQKEFNASPIDEQIRQVLLFRISRSLQLMELNIRNMIDHDNRYRNTLRALSISESSHLYEGWFYRNCSTSKEFAEEALLKVRMLQDRSRIKNVEDYKELEKYGPIHFFKPKTTS